MSEKEMKCPKYGWQCKQCGVVLHFPTMVLQDAECDCGKGVGKWVGFAEPSSPTAPKPEVASEAGPKLNYIQVELTDEQKAKLTKEIENQAVYGSTSSRTAELEAELKVRDNQIAELGKQILKLQSPSPVEGKEEPYKPEGTHYPFINGPRSQDLKSQFNGHNYLLRESVQERCNDLNLAFSEGVQFALRTQQADKERIKELEKWVSDLHSGMFINCVYCGHNYGPKESTPVSMAEVLKEHIEVCPQHPASKLKEENKRLESELKDAQPAIQAFKDWADKNVAVAYVDERNKAMMAEARVKELEAKSILSVGEFVELGGVITKLKAEINRLFPEGK